MATTPDRTPCKKAWETIVEARPARQPSMSAGAPNGAAASADHSVTIAVASTAESAPRLKATVKIAQAPAAPINSAGAGQAAARPPAPTVAKMPSATKAAPIQRSTPRRSLNAKAESSATISGMVAGSSGPTSADGAPRIAVATMKVNGAPEPSSASAKGQVMPLGHNPMRHHTGAKANEGTAKRSSAMAAGSSDSLTAWRVATIQPAQISTAPRPAAAPVRAEWDGASMLRAALATA